MDLGTPGHTHIQSVGVCGRLIAGPGVLASRIDAPGVEFDFGTRLAAMTNGAAVHEEAIGRRVLRLAMAGGTPAPHEGTEGGGA